MQSFKTRVEMRYSGQRALDQTMADLYIQKHRIEGMKPPTDMRYRPVGTGFVGLLVDQDVSILGGDWTARVNALNEGDERHVSQKLEPAIAVGFDLMQKYNEVWRPLVRDSRIYGRFVALGPLPVPAFWGTDELKELHEKLENAEGTRKGEIRKEINEYYVLHFPIAWRRWNPPDVYCTFNEKYQPSEVAYCRQMYAAEIADSFGEDALPDRKRSVGPLTMGRKGYKDDEEVDIIEYVNGSYYAVVVPDKTDPRMAHTWEHGMGCTPVTFGETNVLPDNQNDWKWGGAALHIRESIHALDDAYTDLRTIIRAWPKSPLVVTHNTEARGQLDGWPQQVAVTGQENEVIALVENETITRAPLPETNLNIYEFIDRMTNIVALLGVRRDALMGQGPSGQSAVHLNVAQTLEKGELAEAKKGLERGLKHAVELFFRSIESLSNETEGSTTEIPIGQHLRLSAKDVKGRGDFVQTTIDLNLPINEGLAVQAAAQAVQSRLLDPWSARERFLRVENPAAIDDRWLQYELFQISGEVAKTITGARVAGGLEAIASNPALAKKMASLSEFALAGIAAAYTADVPNVGRSQANRGRTGAGQDISQLNGNAQSMPVRLP